MYSLDDAAKKLEEVLTCDGCCYSDECGSCSIAATEVAIMALRKLKDVEGILSENEPSDNGNYITVTRLKHRVFDED